MSLRDELKSLKRQQREELRVLRYSYARTKREYARAVSPDRLIRRHMGASLGAAALAGFLLAPQPGPKGGVAGAGGAAMSGIMGTVTGLLGRLMPKKGGGGQPTAEKKVDPAEVAKAARPSLVTTMLSQALGMIMAKVNWQELLKNYMRQVRGAGANGHHNGHRPTMQVGDAGSLRT